MWKERRCGKRIRAEAIKEGYRIIKTRWIDIDKGDEGNPDYRSWLVGKEYNTGQEEGLFASTPPPPPLEALRWLISEAAAVESAASPRTLQRRKGREEERVILISDVSRAFFEAPMLRKLEVELPRGGR